ncbi:hypothetical protein L1987_85415 [Smallanthus sonchifolius]|uniref:Uncharacterized protein n=1 Tax=Smallanthus sonchifolius TaxID=185202 RepID=A0ACB8XVT1_9ASTR|nr:hypothetical protein L1987_85415 [Smallanthus sonchifolius]
MVVRSEQVSSFNYPNSEKTLLPLHPRSFLRKLKSFSVKSQKICNPFSTLHIPPPLLHGRHGYYRSVV